jgi:acyl-CoA thioesterase I
MGSYTVRAMVFLTHIFTAAGKYRGWKPFAGVRGVVAIAAIAVLATIPARAAAENGMPLTIVVLGDSLVAGYGLAPGDSFPEQLQARLHLSDPAVEIVNAGVSGDTTAGGLARLDWSIPENAEGVILELGANDALRGIDPAATRQNLERILRRLDGRGQAVLLVGMLAPPNLGQEYGEAFRTIFTDLATNHEIPLYPFFLEGVAAKPALNLADGMHPNREGVAIMVDGMLPLVREFVADLRAGAAVE